MNFRKKMRTRMKYWITMQSIKYLNHRNSVNRQRNYIIYCSKVIIKEDSIELSLVQSSITLGTMSRKVSIAKVNIAMD